MSPAEAAEMVPIIDPAGLTGALFDPHEGNLDPHGATHAYAGRPESAAQKCSSTTGCSR